jgi:hypothetical protein
VKKNARQLIEIVSASGMGSKVEKIRGLALYSNVENTCMTAFFSLRGEVCTAKISLPT